MISFKEFLTEVFDNPYPSKKTNQDSTGSRYHLHSFETPNDRYDVGIQHLKHKAGHAELLFSSVKGDIHKSGAEKNNAHRIFSTVHHIVKNHMAEHPDIHSLSFSGAKDYDYKTKGGTESSRTRLYRHIAKKFSNKHTEEHTPGSVYFN